MDPKAGWRLWWEDEEFEDEDSPKEGHDTYSRGPLMRTREECEALRERILRGDQRALQSDVLCLPEEERPRGRPE